MKFTPTVFALILLTGFAWAWAQEGPIGDPGFGNANALNLSSGIDADIPQAALLTDKGMQMAARLRMLRDAESRMGSKHPSLPDVQRQIAQIRTQLRDWADKPVKDGDLPPKQADQTEFTPQELQQIVLRLAEEVEVLKQKVARLENQR